MGPCSLIHSASPSQQPWQLSKRFVPLVNVPLYEEGNLSSGIQDPPRRKECKNPSNRRISLRPDNFTGVVQITEVILNGMVLMCIVASYFVLAGFSASFASGSGFGNNYYSPFEGSELEEVRRLDQQYTVLRSPLIYSGVAVSLGLGVLTMGVLVQGAKSLAKLPGKWLLLEATFSLLAAVGYCVGIGVYLHAALQINSTDTCKKRERLYARRGLTWMNCQLAGTDGAAATFACLLVIMYGVSVVLALRSYRKQKLYKDSQEQPGNYSDVPQYLWSGTL
ncbi:PREDICTED: MARVEL domain-containing protein 3-like [Chinchilla lanigera]|uniref:MARVEL domain-containing protein 3-like n=1 Tax=Chinchilla lanigera TaxID=34839 RepID=UPI000698B903|nr:PREDICTED: MARVEL domain-containing protein 3-like [Chinchilla lanigera]